MLLVPKLLGDRERREAHPPACAGWLVHLSEHKGGPRDHAGASHVGQELLSFARPLADSGKHRDPFLVLGRAANQLHHQNGLADTGAAEHPGLTAPDEGRQQVDDLDSCLEHLALAALSFERRRRSVDRHPRDGRVDGRPSIDRVSKNVQHPAEDRVADRNGDGGSHPSHAGAATETAGPLQRDSANRMRVVVTLDLRHDAVAGRHFDLERLPDSWK